LAGYRAPPAMKWTAGLTLLSALQTGAVQLQANEAGSKRTISQVVELLKTMLENSAKAADNDRSLFVKYKCYCDTNEQEKKDAIKKAEKAIELLTNEVDELLGANSELSQEVAKLKADMDKNEQMQADAVALRGKEKDAFDLEEADLDAAVKQLGNAISALAAIGADQSMASAAHENFMAGYKDKKGMLLRLRTSVNQALLAAGSVLKPAQRKQVQTFLQANAPSPRPTSRSLARW